MSTMGKEKKEKKEKKREREEDPDKAARCRSPLRKLLANISQHLEKVPNF